MLEGLGAVLPRRLLKLRRRTRRWLCVTAWMFAAGFLLLSHRPSLSEQAARLASGQAMGGAAVPGFHFGDAERNDPLAAQARGTVRLDPAELAPYFWGNWSAQGPRKIRLVSTEFPLDRSFLYIPIAGFTSAEGNDLQLEVVDAHHQLLATVYCRVQNPGELVRLWAVDIRGWRGFRARIVAEGRAASAQGWFGIGTPISATRGGHSVPATVQAPPAWYQTMCLVSLGLFLAGCFMLDPAESAPAH